MFTFWFPVLGTFLIAALLFQYVRVSSPTTVFAEVPSGLPVRLIIPRVHLNAGIEEIYQTADGLLAPAKLALNVGWHHFSSLPGEKGSAVITGAVHWKYGSTAVFGDLHFLKLGDTLMVQNDRGERLTFIVRALRAYELNADISETFRSNDDRARLVLITSDGSWDAPSKSYSRRLVVFAEREGLATVASALEEEKTAPSYVTAFPESSPVTDVSQSDGARLTGSIYGR